MCSPCYKLINRRDQLRGKYEVWYQHEYQSRPECRPQRGARRSGLIQVLIPVPSTFPSRLVLLLSYLSTSQPTPISIYLHRVLNSTNSVMTTRHVVCFDHMTRMLRSDWLKSVITREGDNTLVITPCVSRFH